MSAYVPVSKEAVNESYKMMPSNNLFSPATHSVAFVPSNEMAVGLYFMAEVHKETNLSFPDRKSLESAVKEKKLSENDVATIGGVKTTLGRIILDSHLPPSLQGGPLLKDLNYKFVKGEQQNLFDKMGTVDRKNYPDRINTLKNIGNEKVTLSGFSFGLDDITPHKNIRDPIFSAADKKAANLNLNKKDDLNKFVSIYEEAMKTMDKDLKKDVISKERTNLDKLETATGIKGKGYRQLVATPVLFVDAKMNVVPSAVRKSYAEGLDTADYWAATSGGRKGIIQKVVAVSEPGYLTKLMTNSTMNVLVTQKDCGSDRGINLDIGEPDISGRYTAVDIKLAKGVIPKNTLITQDIIDKLKNAKITKVVVRSPMRCNTSKGLCQHCMGLNENGDHHDLGTNIGILSSQALGERGTQLAMRSFHSGGAFEGTTEQALNIAGAGIDRATTLLSLPKKVKGSAVLAKTNGKIESFTKDPAGGVNINIGGVKHYVPASREMIEEIKIGAEVKRGEPITKGPVNPHEMLPLTGVNRVQGQLATEMHKIYGPLGIRRRNSEVLVQAITGMTKVVNPGDHPTLLPGDFVSTNVVHDWNRKKGKDAKPVEHTPVLRGVHQLPLDMQTDWIARMNHERLKETVVEAAQQGWSSQLHGTHPIPPMVHGAEFGKGTPDKPWEY
jgi:DNA-directed RNA polymerase subunit beta'